MLRTTGSVLRSAANSTVQARDEKRYEHRQENLVTRRPCECSCCRHGLHREVPGAGCGDSYTCPMLRSHTGLLLIALASCAAPQVLPLTAASPAAAPLIIAHRGASAEAPENTLAAYALAIEQGALLAECDIYLTADGVPVLFHDSDLERTTNGRGPIINFSLAHLKELDAGSWKNAAYAGETIPTLVEFLLAVKGKLRPVIEIKGKDREIESQVIRALRQAQFPSEDVMIFSFHYQVVEKIARLDPALPTTWLVTPPEAGEDAGPFFRRALEARVSALGVSHDKLTPSFLRRAHESGLSLFVWTVNDAQRMVQLANMGVDGVITDRPALALEVLRGQATAGVQP